MRERNINVWRKLTIAMITAAVFSLAGTVCFAADASLNVIFEENGLQAEIMAVHVPDDVYAAQVTIPLASSQDTFTVTPAIADTVCEIRRSGSDLVIYLDHKGSIVNQGMIHFGSIAANNPFRMGAEAELLTADELLQGSISAVKVNVSRKSSDTSFSSNSSGTSSDAAMKPTIEAAEHGSVKVSADGNSITIVADEGYEIADVLINGKSVGAVSSYTFQRGDKARKVKVVFQKKTNSGAAAFTDVPAAHWAKEAIDFVVSNQLFFGTDTDKFAPNDQMTRAMFVTVMSRFEASLGDKWRLPSNEAEAFRDVPSDAWYAQAVAWSRGAHLVSGIEEGIFAPDAPITREQMAVLFVRYADLCGIALPQIEQAIAFADGGTISPWAQDAVKKAQQAGILRGREDGSFAPQDDATRAEVASMLMHFIKNVG